MITNPKILVGIICAVFILYVCLRLFIRPVKWLLKLVLSCIVGAFVLFGTNCILAKFGIQFALNPLTSAISGILGLPGIVMILILQSVL